MVLVNIYHILEKAAWGKAREARFYKPTSLKDVGFIRNSTLEQVLTTANESYKGNKNLLLLVINTKKVGQKIVFETTTHRGEKYPNIYGPLTIDAVERVMLLTPDEDGSFTQLPE